MNLGAQRCERALQLCDYRITFGEFGFELCVEALDRRERYAIGVHHPDRSLIVTKSKGCMEVLRRGPDVPNAVRLDSVAPTPNWEP